MIKESSFDFLLGKFNCNLLVSNELEGRKKNLLKEEVAILEEK